MILSLDRCAACDYVLIRRVWRVGPRTQQSGVLKFREVEKTLFTKNIFKKNTPEKEVPMQVCTASSFFHGVRVQGEPTPLVTAPQGWGHLWTLESLLARVGCL